MISFQRQCRKRKGQSKEGNVKIDEDKKGSSEELSLPEKYVGWGGRERGRERDFSE